MEKVLAEYGLVYHSNNTQTMREVAETRIRYEWLRNDKQNFENLGKIYGVVLNTVFDDGYLKIVGAETFNKRLSFQSTGYTEKGGKIPEWFLSLYRFKLITIAGHVNLHMTYQPLDYIEEKIKEKIEREKEEDPLIVYLIGPYHLKKVFNPEEVHKSIENKILGLLIELRDTHKTAKFQQLTNDLSKSFAELFREII